jgi:hypothetical protein
MPALWPKGPRQWVLCAAYRNKKAPHDGEAIRVNAAVKRFFLPFIRELTGIHAKCPQLDGTKPALPRSSLKILSQISCENLIEKARRYAEAHFKSWIVTIIFMPPM